MFQQLRLGDASEQVSWTRMFQVMKQYCVRYAPPHEAQARRPLQPPVPLLDRWSAESPHSRTMCVHGPIIGA